ncbi:MAG: hypothetical protein J6R54_01885 [Bacteroidaceae bacterium]|nr:hypothetical protein [Bacteroidaceae bacterium]
MKRAYKWGWQISKEGFRAIASNHMTMEEINKRWYVHQFLDPSVHEANCGWHGLNYFVCDIDGENRREFVLMYADKNDTPNGARWIDVTGDSKGAIAEAVWGLVFA